jgi:hypothetical protein
MSNVSKNLWSDVAFDLETEETPIGLLKTQASMLFGKTNGILKGEISTYTEKNVIYNTFYIVAPRLDHYRCALMMTVSGPALYPVYIYDYSSPDGNAHPAWIKVKLPWVDEDEMPFASYEVSDYANFEATVKDVFSSNETVGIIRSLVSQSKALMPVLPAAQSVVSSMASPNMMFNQ